LRAGVRLRRAALVLHAESPMDSPTAPWEEQLATLRHRADDLRRSSGHPQPLRGPAGPAALARLREVIRPLLDGVAAAYEALCPPGYPSVEDNGIEGPGGSVGLRFSRWHAIFFALEHAPKKKAAEAKPAGLAGALGVVPKRLPGEPLPPPDPNAETELTVQLLRWDEGRGWVEVRRPLHPRWTLEMLQEHLVAYLIGLNYDLTAGLPAG
ncbi:MAG: hypothetical protein ACRDI2_05955, partial [Chloroflexota bacterium]